MIKLPLSVVIDLNQFTHAINIEVFQNKSPLKTTYRYQEKICLKIKCHTEAKVNMKKLSRLYWKTGDGLKKKVGGLEHFRHYYIMISTQFMVVILLYKGSREFITHEKWLILLKFSWYLFDILYCILKKMFFKIMYLSAEVTLGIAEVYEACLRPLLDVWG